MTLRFNHNFGLASAVCLLLATPVWAQSADDVLAARQAALDANAEQLASDLLEDGDDTLAKARRYSDQGKPAKATAEYNDAAQLFRDAELSALQTRVLAEARRELRAAQELRAKRYAPRTLQRAETLANEAKALLVNDRTAIEAATNMADTAAATARLAQQICQAARSKPSTEDLLLAQAAALWQLQGAAGLPQIPDQNRQTATAALAAEIERLRQAEVRLGRELDQSMAFAAALQNEIRILDERLGGASAERRELVMKLEEQARKREQLEQAKALFAPAEAEVFQQSGNIVARLTGLNFASGSARFDSESEAIIAKLSALIGIYPAAILVIEGHTDSRGSDRLNQRLSQNRAQAVMNQLIQDNAVAADRISAVGYGETRPIANNETEQGRRQNRRIDLLIMATDD